MVWDPTQGGDEYDNGTPTLAQTVTANSLYTKAQLLQWYPDAFGGGPTQPVTSDILVEQTVTPVPSSARAFHLHYKVTHLGSDLHTNAVQQVPVIYATGDLNQFVYYGGSAPWTNGAVSTTQFSNTYTGPFLWVPEHWGALLNAQNIGLTLYVPSQYPWVSGQYFAGSGGPTGDATSNFSPLTVLSFTPNFVFESDAYVIVGDYQTARQVVYDLHQTLPAPNIFAPYGSQDTPAQSSVIVGVTSVTGWAIANGTVASVQVLVDGIVDGTATYGSPRPDVAMVLPNAPVNIGFAYSLDTTKYSNGAYIVNIRVADSSGNVAIFANRSVTISN